MVKMVSHGKHITIIIQQLNKFNPENQSMEDFLNESAKMLQTLNVAEEKFVLETLAGCIEYKSLLDVVVSAFFARDGRYCLISERNLYIVICYLATFQLEELGLQHFSRIVKSLDTAKMHKFLRFFFNALYLNTWIKDEWSQLYDSLYVKENWIDPLLRWQPKVQQLVEQLADKLSNRTADVKISTVTQPKEFNLTVPKPRAVPVPLPIPVLEKSSPVPPSTYKPPKEKKQLEKIKTKNRQKAEDLLLKANTNQFRCAAMKPEKAEFELQNTQDSMKSRPAFQAQKIQSRIDNIPIKLNAAAILREGALYQRKMEQELQRIENLLRGTGDPSEFLEWQKQMRGKDLEQQLAEIECRRLRGKLSHEEAVLAHQNVIQENKKKADLMREEKAELMHEYAERCLQEQKEMRELMEKVVEGHKNAKEAKLKLQKYKQQIVQEVCEENRELLRQALEEEEEKFKKKYELIQQIRAIESLPILKHKFVDLTETGGHGLICEMSIVELRERLALLREAQKAAEEEKRDQIIHDKQAKEQLLLDKLDQISLFRAELGRAAALKQEEKKRKSQSGERQMKDERILDLQRKIVEKAMERKKQAGLLKITPKKASTASRKDSLQWNHWKELEESRERRFKTLQYGFMARETAQKMAAYEAARSGATACILRSEVK
ncbi:cilia- and flagella-associated protein 99 [Numida meleagris]|uniref:cilia- and flagella-associated protein 99 n=1 Tax=Numida meleagris TaxID=8996 RepID=UPI000B3DEC76|nr:cilia- and flagella-associated protein 99 [Numida meleagris]XP_021250538.1 cilia- and flagella-associated protein 99 [Numida meleagris]XP_021250539.1 cilia- and flagella-associated protein 99 [Numida meleagris]XP_021250540.1 cilia- and flagella-associated protein 99 [Numida meleagris]